MKIAFGAALPDFIAARWHDFVRLRQVTVSNRVHALLLDEPQIIAALERFLAELS